METKERILNEIGAICPPILLRNHPEFKTITGINGSTMANLDLIGKGPILKVRMGKKLIGYPKAAILKWIEERLEYVEE